MPLVDGPVLVVATEELLVDSPKGSLPLSGRQKATTKASLLSSLSGPWGKELCRAGGHVRKFEDGTRAAASVCAGATTVALEPEVNAQRPQKARTSSERLWVMEESAFFFYLLSSDLLQIHRGLCVSDY